MADVLRDRPWGLVARLVEFEDHIRAVVRHYLGVLVRRAQAADEGSVDAKLVGGLDDRIGGGRNRLRSGISRRRRLQGVKRKVLSGASSWRLSGRAVRPFADASSTAAASEFFNPLRRMAVRPSRAGCIDRMPPRSDKRVRLGGRAMERLSGGLPDRDRVVGR